MLTAKRAIEIANEAGATDSHVADYLKYLLNEIENAAKQNQYSITVMSTRNETVTAKVVKQLHKLGYESYSRQGEIGGIEIYVSWEVDTNG